MDSRSYPEDSDGKILEVVEDEQAQAPEVAAEYHPPTTKGSSASESTDTSSPPQTTSGSTSPQSPGEVPPFTNNSRVAGGNGFRKPRAFETSPSSAPNDDNGGSAFNQFRNEFLTAARRAATTKKQAIGEVVEWASGASFKHGDVGRMTEADTPKMRAATELAASAQAPQVADRKRPSFPG